MPVQPNGLLARHHWAVARIAEYFGLEPALVEGFVATPSNFKLFADLFAADLNSPSRLYVYYQAPDLQAEDGEACENRGSDPELFLGHGQELTKLRRKCCFFNRACRVGEPVDLNIGADDGILFGTIDANALETLQTLLSVLYLPMLETVGPWGKAKKEQVTVFTRDLDKLGVMLREALNSLISDWQLQKPDKEYDPDDRALIARASQEESIVVHFEDILESWCTGVEENMRTEEDDGDKSGVGPMTELDYWRRRLQRFTSITEQLKQSTERL